MKSVTYSTNLLESTYYIEFFYIQDTEQCHPKDQPLEDHSPTIVVDDESLTCLEYADQGYR